MMALLAAFDAGASAQGSSFLPVPRFPLSSGPLSIQQPVQPGHPFTVAGDRGAILGRQDGSFELWSFPVKVLRDFRISAELADYPVPIDLNQQAAAINVFPDHTTIVYSHAAITVKQHMFVGQRGQAAGVAAVVLFEIQSIRPVTLTFSFAPELLQQWPAPNYGVPSASWVDLGNGGGGYLLETNNPHFFGMVAMPRSSSGILPPYQEQPRVYPLQFILHFDPQKDDGLFFPLLAEISDGQTAINADAVGRIRQQIVLADEQLAGAYRGTQEYYAHFFDKRLTIDTPDRELNEAVRWAEVAIEQAKVTNDDATSLVAGWYGSGDSARPGFGWYFGRDALWSLYAVNSYGDFELSRQVLEFLSQRQRADGKMMHEFSMTANMVDWKSLPYEYAAADATPLFIMAMKDYVETSGDVTFLKSHWQNVKNAYQYMRSHSDSADGVYDNTNGTGWVEAWPPKMPHQEMYLAALDQQSTDDFSRLARLEAEDDLAASAAQKAKDIRAFLDQYRANNGTLAFSRNADGSFDFTPTVYPSVAWWTGELKLDQTGAMFEQWAGHHFSTDWGVRAVADTSPVYDPIAYHQGTVWPLFTGWISMAEYRDGQPLAGYAHLMENAGLTWSQDLGSVTEVLSGAFFQPLGRSSSHQLWSSAMVITPAVRGLLGIQADVLHRNLIVRPHVPASWDSVVLHNLPFGSTELAVEFRRRGAEMAIEVNSPDKTVLCLNPSTDEDCKEPAKTLHTAVVTLPQVELGIAQALPEAGAETAMMKVLDEQSSERELKVKLEAPGGSTQNLSLRVNGPDPKGLSFAGGVRQGDNLLVAFPPGTGYQTQTVDITWGKGR
jgi:glycogen debranching enzyme